MVRMVRFVGIFRVFERDAGVSRGTFGVLGVGKDEARVFVAKLLEGKGEGFAIGVEGAWVPLGAPEGAGVIGRAPYKAVVFKDAATVVLYDGVKVNAVCEYIGYGGNGGFRRSAGDGDRIEFAVAVCNVGPKVIGAVVLKAGDRMIEPSRRNLLGDKGFHRAAAVKEGF